MSTIRINYLDKSGAVIATHDTGDDYLPEEIEAWQEWLNDPAVEHPGAPDGWDQFDLVPTP
jgi:hypothetical protein